MERENSRQNYNQNSDRGRGSQNNNRGRGRGRGSQNNNRGQGRGRGRGDYTSSDGQPSHAAQPNNNARGNNFNDNRRGEQQHRPPRRDNTYEEKPLAIGQLIVWLRRTLEADPDQVLADLTGRDAGKLKSALNGTVIFERGDVPVMMIRLLSSPYLMDHIRSSTSDSLYSVLIESQFPNNLATRLRHRLVRVGTENVTLLIKLISHLIDLFPDSVANVDPLIDFLVSNADLYEESVVVEIEHLVTKKEIILEQKHQKLLAQEREQRGERDFRDIPLFPSKEEMFRSPVAQDLRKNKVEGQIYEDLNEYLDTHFRLIHEDAFADIRKAVFNLHQGPVNQRMTGVKIYPRVLVLNARLDHRGVFYQLQISSTAKVNWKRSKRLMPGSLLCLSSDNFASDLLWATIADRDENKLSQGKIEVELTNGYDPNFHAGKEYTIIEASSAYFEAFAPVLRALQSKGNNVPFQDYLLKYSKVIAPPKYLRNDNVPDNDVWDLTPTFPGAIKPQIHLLKQWPETGELGPMVDASQLAALEQTLTKEFAIVQGPPGTGKTYIGLQAVKLMLANGAPKPILCVCYTNHALDQFLEGIYKFEDKIIRLGGRSKSELMQKECSLYSSRWDSMMPKSFMKHRYDMLNEISEIKNKILSIAKRLDEPYVSLNRLDEALDPRLVDTLMTGPGQKVSQNMVVKAWLEENQPKNNNKTRVNNDSGSRVESKNNNRINREELSGQMNNDTSSIGATSEDSDNDEELDGEIDEEALKELLADRHDDEADEPQGGSRDAVFNVQHLDGDSELDREEFEQLLDTLYDVDSLWQVDVSDRRKFHNHLLRGQQLELHDELNRLNAAYIQRCRELKQLSHQRTMALLRQANVIGMTTTAAAKNVELLRALKPKIVIVEEAAEVLEAHIITALTKDTQHLILIGDHQQLRPSTAVYAMSKKYNLDVSLFERMTKNNMPFRRLSTQRRMRPEISQLISPIYKQLSDHPTVYGHPRTVKGVEKNVFFLDHTVPEQTAGDSTSKFNDHEVMLVSNLCLYLVQQGYKPDKITVLTMYLQQLFRIKEQLKVNANYNPDCGQIRVSSVDNYQGEENDIIILSLVRSNTAKSIGFLRVPNRVCVALSRARNAFYMFGNAQLLQEESQLWRDVVQLLRDRNSIGSELKLTCQNHPQSVSLVKTGLDIREKAKDGGCTLPCTHRLDCGHSCKKFCHPDGHDTYICYEPCARLHTCGHSCGKCCFDECSECKQLVPVTVEPCQHEMMVPCNKSALPVVCTKHVS